MKKNFAAFILAMAAFISVAFFPTNAASYGYDFSSFEELGAAVCETNTSDIIIYNNLNEKYYPGSITKLLTVFCANDLLEKNETITLTEEMLALTLPNSSTADLETGETLTYEQLCYATLLPSGNDAARVISVWAGQRLSGETGLSAQAYSERFVAYMNERAALIGMSGSNFTNPDGYDDENGYSTPNDMLLLAKAVIKDSEIIKICATSKYTIETNVTKHEWYNSDMFLHVYDPEEPDEVNPFYDARVKGLKTGFTDIGQRCFMFYASDETLSYVGVVMCVPLRPLSLLWERTGNIIDYAFDNYQNVVFLGENESVRIETVANPANIFRREITLGATSNPFMTLKNDAAYNYTAETVYNEELVTLNSKGKLKLQNDIICGDVVLTVKYIYNGETIAQVDYAALNDTNRMSVVYVGIYVISASGIFACIYAPVRILKNKKAKRKRNGRKIVKSS